MGRKGKQHEYTVQHIQKACEVFKCKPEELTRKQKNVGKFWDFMLSCCLVSQLKNDKIEKEIQILKEKCYFVGVRRKYKERNFCVLVWNLYNPNLEIKKIEPEKYTFII